MPYVNTDDYNKYLDYQKAKKKKYKAVNEYNKKHYTRLTTTMTIEDGREFKRICKEMGLSVNNMIKGLIVDFMTKYYESKDDLD